MLLAMLGAFAVAVSISVPQLSASASGPADSFQAGNIIGDEHFYDGNAMTVAEVQRFLNEQVPECWLGRPGYEVGKPVYWGGPTKLASKCLRDYTSNTASIAADAYCAGMPGMKNELAASVIVRVGKACGISPRVLLVMLNKEQSLITDPWPNENQYYYAMGYACPDSGPGGSANCDPSQGGFAKQVYRAAWQYKVYRAHPDSYRYKAFQTNTIQWHPNIGCGTSQVFIENQATAALYNYTPYRPNQAALNAGWGTGDACSSYGNRNFYMMYRLWFGATHSFTVHPRLVDEYQALGGPNSSLGKPRSEATLYADGGVGQSFEGGSMYWSPQSVASAVSGPIRDFYWANGSINGWLGYPNGRLTQYSDGGMGQAFRGASVYWSARTGAQAVRGDIRAVYWANGSMYGPLGYPKGNETQYADGGKGQGFEKGSVYWSSSTGGRYLIGSIRQYYWNNGSTAGRLGYPTSDPVPDGEVMIQTFQGGTVVGDSAGRAASVDGAVLDGYLAGGGGVVLGAPTGERSTYADGGIGQGFKNGSIYGAPGSAAYPVQGAIRKYYWDTGSVSGPLGYPMSTAGLTSTGVEVQRFAGGSVYLRQGKAVSVQGKMAERYGELGNETGILGIPLSSSSAYPDGGQGQGFEFGSMYQRPGGSAFETTGAIRQAFWDSGSVTGTYGYPTSAAVCGGGHCTQQFERGSITVQE